MKIDLDDLDRKARAAGNPSGRWMVHRCQFADEGKACAIHDDQGNPFCQDGSRDECHHLIPLPDAEHIAANDPSTALTLTARIRELEQGLHEALNAWSADMPDEDPERERLRALAFKGAVLP